MRKFVAILVALALFLTWSEVASSGDDDGRALVAKAIKAAGGEKNLAKMESITWKEKGTYYGMGDGLPYTGDYAIMPGKFRMVIKDVFTMIVNGDKGWTSGGGKVTEMSKEQVAAEGVSQKAGMISSLLPLKDKAFTIVAVPSKDEKVNIVSVTRKGYPEVKLHFDKKTGLRVKHEFMNKAADLQFKEVRIELTFSDFKEVEGAMMPHKIDLKRDGKRFVEAELSEIKSAKHDPKIFGKPGND